jgi:hypothetical protein
LSNAANRVAVTPRRAPIRLGAGTLAGFPPQGVHRPVQGPRRPSRVTVEFGVEQPGLLQCLLAHADQRFVQRRRERPAEPGTREQRIRLLGAFGIRHGPAEQAEPSLDDQLAAVYLPPERDGAPVLAALRATAYLLEVLIDPAK